MTRDTYRRFPFDGLKTNGALPDEYSDHFSNTSNTLADVIATTARDYNIDTVPAGYYDADRDEWVRVPHWKATVNPTWLGDGLADSPQADKKAAWAFPTTEYTPVGPDTWWEPLAEAIDARGTPVFGELRLSRSGAEQVLDVYFPEVTVPFDDEDDKILGLSTGHDYLSGRKLSARVIALDPSSNDPGGPTVYRDLTDPRKRKHTGDASDDVVVWWDAIIDRMEEAADELHGVIADAMNYEIDIGGLPCTIHEFYTHLGLPETTLAEAAADRAMKTCPGAWTAYHLQRSAAYVLEHGYGGKDSRTFANHVATINTLLFQPDVAEKTVLKSVRNEMDDGQTTLAAHAEADDAGDVQPTVAELDDAIESIDEGKSAFRSSRERLRTMLTDMENEDEDDATDADDAAPEEVDA